MSVSARITHTASFLVAGSMAVLVAACGSSHAKKPATAPPQTVTESKPTSSASSVNGCRVVSAPTPKGSQHIHKPRLTLDPSKRYVVSLETNCGKIEIALDVKQAPKTAASFAYLVRRGFYDSLTFHRVVPGFVIQGGDPDGNGSGGPGYTVVEKPPPDTQYGKGVVAMAKTASDPSGASGSQFFIVTGSDAGLPPQYALLGTVVGGQSTVQRISHVSTEAGPDGEDSTPSIPIVIDQATLSVS